MNTELQICKKRHGNRFYQEYTAFGKTMENVRKHRDIKLLTTEARKNY